MILQRSARNQVLRGEADAILVTKLDRLSRSTVDLLAIFDASRRGKLYELRRGTIDAGRTAAVISDLRLLYEAARPDERRELIRLAIKRITYNGPTEPPVFEFFDGGAVYFPLPRSKLRTKWLRLKDSNLGPGG